MFYICFSFLLGVTSTTLRKRGCRGYRSDLVAGRFIQTHPQTGITPVDADLATCLLLGQPHESLKSFSLTNNVHQFYSVDLLNYKMMLNLVEEVPLVAELDDEDDDVDPDLHLRVEAKKTEQASDGFTEAKHT